MSYGGISSLLALILFVSVGGATSAGSSGSPEFAVAIRNVTVPLGREAVLSCVINNLAEYKVGWLRADDQTILSLHRRVVTHNPRVSVTHDESRTWNLHIRQVKESDQGCYMCQINTATMKKQLGCVQVQVPPDIVDERSTSDVTVNEGDNVTLTCTATGKPAPRIVWRREDGHKIVVASRPPSNNKAPLVRKGNATTPRVLEWSPERSKEVDAFHGETLRLYRVTRQMMAAYMCIASNDVPPAVSKRVPLNVNFPPLVTASMNVVGALLGNDVRLTCTVESHPPSINYWIKGRHQEHNTILPSTKYSIEGERGSSSPGYKTSMTLVIHDFQPADKSAYICVAANSLGTAEASIQIYEVATSATTGAVTSRPFPSSVDGQFHRSSKQPDDGHNNKKHSHLQDTSAAAADQRRPPAEQKKEEKEDTAVKERNSVAQSSQVHCIVLVAACWSLLIL